MWKIVKLVFLINFVASGLAFGKESQGFDQIYRFAQFSSSIYLSEQEVRKQKPLERYQLDYYGHIPEIEISYFLQTDEQARHHLVAVRGTSNIENAFVDIAVKLKFDEQAGIRLHEGFSGAAKAIYAELKSKLKPGYRISTTGHSLGGAVALILAMYL